MTSPSTSRVGRIASFPAAVVAIVLSLCSTHFGPADAFLASSASRGVRPNCCTRGHDAPSVVVAAAAASRSTDDENGRGVRRREAATADATVRRRPSSLSTASPPPPPSSPREPAGVESIFALVKTVRRRVTTRIVMTRRRGRRRRVVGRSRRARRAAASSDFGGGVAPALADDVLSTVDIWRLDEIASGFSSDVASALRDPEEGRRLAAAKLLLEDDLRALRERAVDVPPLDDGSTTTTDLISAYPDVYGDMRLLRFLRKDREQDPASTSVRFREFIRWRADNNIDDVRAILGQNPHGFIPEELNMIERYVPCDFDLGDGSGFGDSCPPVLLNAGRWDTAGLTRAIQTGKDGVTLDKFLEYWIYVYESIHLRLYEISNQRGEVAYVDEVCDLNGMSLGQFNPAFVTRVLKPWLSVTQENYPETARRIYFFEPPKIIDVVWRIVTPMVSERTVNKVRFQRGYDGTSLDFIRDGATARVGDGAATDEGGASGSSSMGQPALYA